MIAYRYKTVPVQPKHEPEVVAELPRLTAAELRPALELAFGPRNSIRNIQDEVAQFYGVSADYMRVPDQIGAREPRVSHPRQMAMVMVREFTPFSLPEIGRRFGGRDHTTVLYALRAVAKRAVQDPYVELEMEVLRERFAA